MSKIINKRAKVLANRKIASGYYKIILGARQIAGYAKPGQFIEVRISNSFKPLLRKPFSIHRIAQAKVELLYKVVGDGTRILSAKKPGDYLDIIGPLGNGFNYSAADSFMLVAGGMGVAPLFFLAEKLREKKGIVLIGARNKKEIFCKKDFQKLGYQVKISTDDGSMGYRGKVTDLLQTILRPAIKTKRLTVYACGPDQMLKEIARSAKANNLLAQLSLEAYMACGFGACLGCAVETAAGYKLVCKDGPVFEAKELF